MASVTLYGVLPPARQQRSVGVLPRCPCTEPRVADDRVLSAKVEEAKVLVDLTATWINIVEVDNATNT